MSSLEDAYSRYVLSDEAILERVSEYTLYCKYLGFEPMLRTRYKSQIRIGNPDETPSFSVFESNKPHREYMWKDSGGHGLSGDIFQLIKLLLGLTYQQVLEKIDYDFQLGFGSKEPPKSKIVQYVAPIVMPAEIRIKSKPFTEKELLYWIQFGVDIELLQRFKVHSVDLYWMKKDQQGGNTPRHMMFAYQILSRYQLYQPFAPSEFKFRQNLTDQDLHGFHQLDYTDSKLIITKARKDVMALTAAGFNTVAPRSENTPVAPEYLRFLEGKYAKIYTLFDNDGKHQADRYPYPAREIPKSTGCKDPAEFRAAYGAREFINLIQTLTK